MSSIYAPPGVSPEIAAERNYRRITSTTQLGAYDHQLTERQAQIPGLLFPVYRLGESTPYTYVLRPDKSRMGYDGKNVKYEWPERVPLCLDVLPCYHDALSDPSIPIWITEGAKKADALASAFGSTIVPININGVWGWRRRGKDGASHPIDDLDAIAWAGRRVVLAFDNDVTRKAEVKDALRALERHLTKERGAAVGVLVLPYNDGQKLGVDDALAGGMTPEELRGYVRGLDDLDNVDDLDDLPPEELKRRLRAMIAERAHYIERAEKAEAALAQTQERNRFTTGAIGANIAATGKRLTLIELKIEQDTAPGDRRQDGDMFIARIWKIAQRTNQDPGTVSRHLAEFEREGYIERSNKRVQDPDSEKGWKSATYVRTLVDLSDTTQIVMPAKPRGLHACSRCGSMKVKGHRVLRCTCCGHEEHEPEEWVNPKEIRDMEDQIVASQAAEPELQFAIQEQIPDLDPLTCNMPDKENDPSSDLQTAIQTEADDQDLVDGVDTDPDPLMCDLQQKEKTDGLHSELQTAIQTPASSSAPPEQQLILPGRYQALAAQRKAAPA